MATDVAARIAAARRCGAAMFHPAAEVHQVEQAIADGGWRDLDDAELAAYKWLTPASWSMYFRLGWHEEAGKARRV